MPVPFYKKKENWSLLIGAIAGIKWFSKPHTIAYQVADYSLTIGFPLVMAWLGIDAAKKYNSPSGLSKTFDKVKSLAKK